MKRKLRTLCMEEEKPPRGLQEAHSGKECRDADST